MRRRRRSMFASAPPRRSGVLWLEPGRGRRPRGRRRRSWLAPLLAVLAVGGAAVAAVLIVRHRSARNDSRAAAERFSRAWAAGDERTMWEQLDARSRAAYPLGRFHRLYASANTAASTRSVRIGKASGPHDGNVTIPAAVTTRLFGTLRGTIEMPVHKENGDVKVTWTPHLRLPGVRAGETVTRRVLQTPRRASVLGPGSSNLTDAPALAAIVGHPPSGNDPGTGLERYYDDRLGGRPGAQLRYGKRVVATIAAKRGRSVHTTLRPGLTRAAAAALGGRLGGVAVLRPRDGSVLALAGLGVSAPQPPGSTFKMITTAGALQAGIAKPSSTYPVRTAATLSGVTLRNAGNESCGGSLYNAFVVSCNSVFAPLGAKLGARKLVRMAEALGFNQRPRIPDAKTSTISQPSKLKDSLAVGAAAIGQDRDLATPLQMAAVAAGIGERGVYAKPRVARNDPVVRHRAMSRRVASQLRAMMIGVVRGGTGTAAAIPGVTVAGKTGTAELRPNSSNPKDADAWFAAFAPANKPRVAVAVMLVGAGFGGTAAAPIAKRVLQAAL